MTLVDVDVAHFLVLGFARWNRTERRAAEEGDLDVLREAMKVEEPTLVLNAIEGRVPLHDLVHTGNSARDERVEALADTLFPARHGCNVGLHGSIALAFRNLRVAA